ncbi:MAG: sigma-70 family RNA polymerase sigma factor [Gammaproteobacteria bacterium]
MLDVSKENCILTPMSDWSYSSGMEQAITDEALMLLYKEGDASAFERLYVRHKVPVYRFILRQCGDRSTSDELFQDVWMKLIQAKINYEVQSKFTTFLYTIARNHLIDYYRKQGAHNFNGEFVDMDTIEGRHQDQPDNQMELQRDISRLISGIEALPTFQREALLLREEAGMKLQEIATLTSVNTETVKSRLRYAVKKLHQIMTQ